MDNSQYHPPRTEHSAGIYGNIEKRVFEDSPERLKPPFQFVKDIEKLIDSFRDTAEAIEQANGREVKVRYLPVSLIRPARKREVIRRHLIDVERTLGGQLFAEKNILMPRTAFKTPIGATKKTPKFLENAATRTTTATTTR